MSMQGLQQEYNEAMIFKIFYEQFMNIVQIVQNTYGEFDRDTLALLSQLDPEKKYHHVQNVRKACVVTVLDIIDTEELISRNEARIERLKNEGKEVKAKRWSEANEWNKLWVRKLKGLLTQAKSGYALFRDLALVESFQQKQKRGGILGVGKDALGDMKKKLAAMAGKKEKPPELPPQAQEALVKGVDAGVVAVRNAQKEGIVDKDVKIV